MKGEFIQFVPWMDCNNYCKFCYGHGYQKTSVIQKVNSLKYIQEELSKLFRSRKSISRIGLSGGEFFDGQIEDVKVKQEFYNIISMIAAAKQQHLIERFLINTSLIVNSRQPLEEFIQFVEANNLIDILVVCTSYDLKYRFRTAEAEFAWKCTVDWLKTKLILPLHVEIIVSQFFIDACMNRTFVLEEFKKKVTDNIDYIEPMINSCQSFEQICKIMPDFFVKRKVFLDFVKRECIEEKHIDLNTFLAIDLHSDIVIGYYPNENQWICSKNRHSSGMQVLNNGKIKPVKSYVDSNARMADDVKKLREAYV